MRSASVFACVFVLSSLMVLDASAATVHRPRTRTHVTADPGPGVAAPDAPSATRRFAVPGWSDESTRRWLDNASALVGVGG